MFQPIIQHINDVDKDKNKWKHKLNLRSKAKNMQFLLIYNQQVHSKEWFVVVIFVYTF